MKKDIPDLLFDLPHLILAQKEHEHRQQEVIRFRVNAEDKKMIEQRALEKGYASVFHFLRDLALGT